jgi:hypothetical protein
LHEKLKDDFKNEQNNYNKHGPELRKAKAELASQKNTNNYLTSKLKEKEESLEF